MKDFLNSNFFIALVTLLVGSVAIYIYKKQQKDTKRNAANTVLLEIANAEQIIESAKLKISETRRAGRTQIPEHHYVLPTESWSKYKSLLSKDFTKEQWDRISKFYNDCQLFDETVAYNDNMFINDTVEIRKNVHQGIYKYAAEYAEKITEEKDPSKKEDIINEFKDKKNALSLILTSSEYMYIYSPSKPVNDIELLIDTIETSISISDVGQKLRKIVKGRWWI